MSGVRWRRYGACVAAAIVLGGTAGCAESAPDAVDRQTLLRDAVQRQPLPPTEEVGATTYRLVASQTVTSTRATGAHLQGDAAESGIVVVTARLACLGRGSMSARLADTENRADHRCDEQIFPNPSVTTVWWEVSGLSLPEGFALTVTADDPESVLAVRTAAYAEAG